MTQPRQKPCAHCGLPVRVGDADSAAGPGGESAADSAADSAPGAAGDTPVFCCPGCQTVYHAIQGAGLESFYELQNATGGGNESARAAAENASGRDNAARLKEFDSEAFLDRHTERLEDGRREAEFHLDGVHCAGCVWIVEQLPEFLDGVDDARLNLGRARLRVSWDPEAVRLSEIAEWLEQFGYSPHPKNAVDGNDRESAVERNLLRRMGVSWALAGNVMLLAFALYAGLDAGDAAGLYHAFRGLSFVLAGVSVVYGGSLFFRRAWASLRPLITNPSQFSPSRLSIDIPISVGILGGFLHSSWATLTGHGEVWFDSIAVLIAALLTARWLQIRGRRMAGDAADRLLSVIPSTARHVAPSGRLVPVPTEALEAGYIIEVQAGEVIPADGMVVEGQSAVHRGVLTGESRPERVEVGDRVHAGSKNTGDTVRIEVRAAGEDSRVGRLLQWIDEQGQQRAPVVELADRLAGAFVLLVLTAAAATWSGWTLAGSPEAVRHAVALLVVSCPCALGMATPLAMTMGVGRAASRGIFIKHENALQRLEGLDELILDKTGTVTAGEMEMVEWTGRRDAVVLAGRLEAASTHPVARAFEKWLAREGWKPSPREAKMASAQGEGWKPSPQGFVERASSSLSVERASSSLAEDVEEVAGAGISGQLGGHTVAVGRPDWILQRCGLEAFPAELGEAVDKAIGEAHTPVAIAVDGQPRAVCAFGDPIRPESAELVERMHEAGIRVTLLSGDYPEVVQNVASQIGIAPEDAFGDVAPEDKKAFVEARRAASRADGDEDRIVAMVGDGVNDAAALKAASVGIAVDGSANASLVAADVFTTRGGLAPLMDLIDGSGSVMGVVRRNIGMSVVYNLAGITAASAGLVGPLVAAVAMPISSVAVVISSIIQDSFERRTAVSPVEAVGAGEVPSPPLRSSEDQPATHAAE